MKDINYKYSPAGKNNDNDLELSNLKTNLNIPPGEYSLNNEVPLEPQPINSIGMKLNVERYDGQYSSSEIDTSIFNIPSGGILQPDNQDIAHENSPRNILAFIEEAKKSKTSEADYSSDNNTSNRQNNVVDLPCLFDETYNSNDFKIIDGALRVYKNNKYKLVDGEISLGRNCTKEIKRMALTMRRYPYGELLKHIKIHAEVATKEDYPSFMYFNDIIYDCSLGQQIAYSPDIITYATLPIDYPSGERHESSVFDSFVEAICGGDQSLKNLILTMMAYFLLLDCNDAKKFFILIGPSGSGKSTMGNIVEKLIGREVCSYVPLHKMGDPYSKYNLENKFVNISMDLASSAISRNAMSDIKIITGQDKIYTQVRYEQEHCFTPTAKLLFASNFPLTLSQYDEAFVKRMVCIPFDVIIPESQQDKMLVKKIEMERKGIIQRLIPYAETLLRNNMQFPYCEAAEQLKTLCVEVSKDTLYDFINEHCEFVPKARISTRELFDQYESFCIKDESIPLSENAIHKKLKEYPCTRDRWTVRDSDNQQERGYKGIRLKVSIPENEEDEDC